MLAVNEAGTVTLLSESARALLDLPADSQGRLLADLDGVVPVGLVADRLAELRELQDVISAARRDALVGESTTVLVDAPGVARSHREAPEIDGIVTVPVDLAVGQLHEVRITGAEGPDSCAEPLVLATG